jgi:hypothetical protein
MSSEFITLLANLALTLSFIVAVIFGIAQVQQASRDRRERLTLETLRTFTTREFAELIQYVNSGKVPTTTEQMRALPANEQIMFIQFGQIMESLGQLVFDKFINIDLVDKTLGSYVITTWEKYKTLFLDIREKSNDPYLGEYFQWLAERIEKRMRENPRKPFYQSKSS